MQLTKTVQLAQYAMMSIGLILLLAAAVMASLPVAAAEARGPVQDTDGLGRVTRFVCAHCTSTGKLSSHGLFLNREADIATSKQCHAAQEGIWHIQMEARSCNIMAGMGGVAGSSLDVRHQPECDLHPKSQSDCHMPYININACGAVV